MKKYLLSFLISFLMLGAAAQGPERPTSPPENMNRVSTVGDFTITDTEGNVLNLYTHLDAGYTIFIDLFFTTCGYCQLYAPTIEEIYQNTGAGNENILFWGISSDPTDSNPVIDQYKETYDITNPCAGPDGNGPAAHDIIIDGQNFLGWPTYCVICPDRTMFFDPVYPPTVTGFNPYFEQCSPVGIGDKPEPAAVNSIQSLYPNPAGSEVSVDLTLAKTSQVSITVYNILGVEVIRQTSPLESGKNTVQLKLEKLPEGQYFLRMSVDQKFVEARKLIVSR